VRPNLFQCLNELRFETKVRTLWIEAICIDQTNIRERNHQVGEIRKIYAQAAQVRIWLGNPTVRTKELFEYMNASETERASPTWSSSKLGSSAFVEAMLDVVGREYWSRAWILQEVMVSGSKVIHCGHHSTPLERMQYAVQKAGLHHWIDYSLRGRETASQTLEELLKKHGWAACGDVKDRIYALLGVASDCTPDHPFYIDYSEELYILLCRTISFCKPKRPFLFAVTLSQILGTKSIRDNTFIPQRALLNDPVEANNSSYLKIVLQASRFAPLFDMYFQQQRSDWFDWQHV
jgi:hypothetical protein